LKPSINRPSILLPESPYEYLEADKQNRLLFRTCYCCGEPFSPDNTHTAAGWRETQISGLCEDCFDLLVREG